MIGLALVTLVALLAAGIISNFKGAVNALFTGDYVVTAQNNFSPMPTAVADAAAKTPGLAAIGSVRGDQSRIFGSVENQTAVDPDIGQTIKLDWKQGSQAVFSTLGADGAFTDDGYAKKHHLRVGSPVVLTTPTGDHLRVTIKGIFKPPPAARPSARSRSRARRSTAPTSSRRTSSRSSTCTAARTTPMRPRSNAR